MAIPFFSYSFLILIVFIFLSRKGTKSGILLPILPSLVSDSMEIELNSFFDSQPYGARRHITPFVFFMENRHSDDSGYFWSCYQEEQLQSSVAGAQGQDWNGPYDSAKEAWDNGALTLERLRT
jgi:hypothetical protein